MTSFPGRDCDPSRWLPISDQQERQRYVWWRSVIEVVCSVDDIFDEGQ